MHMHTHTFIFAHSHSRIPQQFIAKAIARDTLDIKGWENIHQSVNINYMLVHEDTRLKKMCSVVRLSLLGN